jgi:hypothetical protein
MTIFTNFSVICGLLLVLYAVTIIIFPINYGSYLGVRSKLTLKSKIIWKIAQKSFAFSLIGIGLILSIIGIFNIDDKIQRLPMAMIFIGLWILAKYFVNKYLVVRFTGE